MAIFDAGSPAYQATATVGGTAIRIWSGTFTALNALSPAVVLRDITIVNTGANTLWVGGSLAASGTAMVLPAGAQLTIQGWTATSGTTTNDIFAVAASGAAASSTIAGLATVASVV